MSPTSRYANCAGYEIHYTEWGAPDAPVVIAWHGLARTGPRGGLPGKAPAITAANVPPLATLPAVGNAIAITAGAIAIPD